METTSHLAPITKLQHGSLPYFEQMVQGPVYLYLLADSHDIVIRRCQISTTRCLAQNHLQNSQARNIVALPLPLVAKFQRRTKIFLACVGEIPGVVCQKNLTLVQKYQLPDR